MERLSISGAEQIEFVRMTKDIDLFASTLNTGVMEKILSYVELYEFGPGEKVFRQGEAGDAFYAVLSGTLRVSVREAFFFSRTVAGLGKGDFFGEMALLNRKPRTATVTCLERCRLFTLLSDRFQSVLRENPSFADEIRKLASGRQFGLRKDA